MTIIAEDNLHLFRITVKGQFSFHDHRVFRDTLARIRASEAEAVELDFSETTYMDSAALGMLLLLKDICQHGRKAIVLSNAEGQILKVLRLSRFDEWLTIR